MKKWILILFFCMPCLAVSVNLRFVDQNGAAASDLIVQFLDSETLCSAAIAPLITNGELTLDLEPGSYYILWLPTESSILARYAGNTDHWDLSSAVPLVVDGGLTGTQEIVVQRGGAISGRINGLPNGVVPQVFVMDAVSFFVDIFPGVVTLNEDNTYTVSGLGSGCYLVGVTWGEMDEPVFFHPASATPQSASLVEVAAGEQVSNVNIDVDISQLGALEVSLGPVESGRPNVNAYGNFTNYSASYSSGSASLLLPPGDYKVNVGFDNTWRSLDLGTQTIVAGQTTSVSRTPETGGVISGTITQNGVSTQGGVAIQILNESGFLISQEELLVVIGSTPYSVSGLEAGTYRVRIKPLGTFTLPQISSSFEIQTSGAINLSEGAQVNGVDFSLVEGSTISGTILNGGQMLLSTLVTAINQDTGLHYSGFTSSILSGASYIIGNLPAGNYKVGINTGEFSADVSESFFLDLFSNPFLGCRNVGPSFHPASSTLAGADTVTVGQSSSLEGVDFIFNTGGGVTGRVVTESGCPVGSGLVAVFQGGQMKRLGLIINGDFEIVGLGQGAYDLRISKLFRSVEAPQDASSIVDLDFLDFFSAANTIGFGQTVNITPGQIQSLGEWTVPFEVVTSEPTPECPEPGENDLQLLYPWVSNRNNSFESIVIVDNYGDESVTVILTATRSENDVETTCRTIPARGFLEETASTLFPTLGSGGGYSVLVSSPSDSVRGRWVTNSLAAPSKQSPSQGVAVRLPRNESEANSRIGREVVFGYLPITGNAISAPVVVNTGDSSADVFLRLYNRDGVEVGNDVQELAPMVPFAVLANSLVSEGSGDVYMTAESTAPITGVSFVFDSVFNEPAIGNVTAIDSDGPDSGSKTLFYPWVSNRDNLFESVVVVNNFGGAPVTVTLTATRGNGETSAPVQKTIQGNGFISSLASELFPDLGSGGGYNVALSSPSSKVSGQWVTNNLAAASKSSPSQGVAIDVSGVGDSEQVGANLLFGYLPILGSFTSAPVIVNAGSQNTLATLRFYNASGDLVGTSTQDLAPGAPFAAIANNLVQTEQNVYLVVSSDGQPLTGVAFVFNGEFNEPAIGNATAIDFQP